MEDVPHRAGLDDADRARGSIVARRRLDRLMGRGLPSPRSSRGHNVNQAVPSGNVESPTPPGSHDDRCPFSCWSRALARASPGEVERGEVAFRPGPGGIIGPRAVPARAGRLPLRAGAGAVDAAILGGPAAVPFADHDGRPREQRRPRRVFPADRPGTEAAGGGRAAHPGGGFPAVAIHGGPAGRPGRRRAVRQAPLLRRAPAGRRGPRMRRSSSPPDIDRTVTAMRQGICDVRRAAAWLATRPEVDPRSARRRRDQPGRDRLVDRRRPSTPSIREGAFLLAGGDLSTILWQMPEGKAFRAALDRVRPDPGRPEGPHGPVRPAGLRLAAQGEAGVHDGGQGRRGRSPPRGPGRCGRRRAGRRSAGTIAVIIRPSASSCPGSAARSISSRVRGSRPGRGRRRDDGAQPGGSGHVRFRLSESGFGLISA